VGLDDDELPRAKDAVHYIADKRITGRIERMGDDAAALLQEVNLPTWARDLPFHLEPSDWRAGYLSVHDYDLAPELHGDLKRCAPQALLRDLFRPEYNHHVWYDREPLVTIDWGGTQALRDAMAAKKLDPLPRLEPILREVQRRRDEWSRVMTERWKPILDDSEPRKEVLTFHERSLNI
jgi:hypothetical protein